MADEEHLVALLDRDRARDVRGCRAGVRERRHEQGSGRGRDEQMVELGVALHVDTSEESVRLRAGSFAEAHAEAVGGRVRPW